MPKASQHAPSPEDTQQNQVWEQQPRESDVAYRAFTTYRDQGADRSLVRTRQALGKSKALVEGWSSRWGWVRRARAYDAMLDRERQAAQAQAVRDMAERHARQAVALQGVAMRALAKVSQQLEAGGELHPETIRGWLLDAMKAERVARGAPDQTIHHGWDDPDPPIAEVLSDPDVQRAARELVEAAGHARGSKPSRPRARDEQ